MKPNKKRMITSIAILCVLAFSLSWASSDGKTYVLEAMPKHPEATGTAVVGDRHINLNAKSLEPESVYTVWFVKTQPKKSETGAGTAPYMFRTDAQGNGSYSAPLSETPFDKWSMIMVVQHPNGDPKDMKNMVGALKAPL